MKDGTRVPSVTTIISRFKESGGLVHWAWQLGCDGKDYRKVRDEAADAGTLAHAMVEAEIQGKLYQPDGYDTETIEKAHQAYKAYQEWKRQTQLRALETECPLVSEGHRFGGTLDAMFVQDKLSLGDWKTSNSIYPDYLVQLSAYSILWRENYPTLPITGGFHLLRFSKEGDFAHHWWGDLREAEEAFLLMRRLYDLMDKLKKRV